MSYNLKLVGLFVKNIFQNKIDEMDHFVSPDFKYVLNLGKIQNFEYFVKRMKLISQTTDPKLSEIETPDDKHFYYNFEVQVADDSPENIISHGSVEIVIHKSLIQRVNVSYHTSQEEYDIFQTRLENSRTAFI